jgi:hypothetical protein
MATLYISEFAYRGSVEGQPLAAVAKTPPHAEQTVAIGGGSLASTAFNAATSVVRIHTDSVCSIAWTPAGAAVVAATTANMRLAANQTEYFAVGQTPNPSGGAPSTMQVSVIANT